MMVLGLTGNIGCGKSTVAKILIKEGYYHIDADSLTKDVYLIKSDEIYQPMFEAFGKEIFDEKNIVDKRKLGPIVFSDKNKLEKLNSIMHPVIEGIIKDEIKKADEENYKAVVFDAALLFETGMEKLCDKILVVYCDDEIQFERIKNRDSLPDDEIRNRIKSQMPQKKKIDMADYSVDNSGTEEELIEQVEKFIELLKGEMA